MENDEIRKYHPDMPQATRYGLRRYFEQGYNIDVGAYSYGVPSLHWSKGDRQQYSLSIGAYCSIAADVSIYIGTQGIHTLDFISTYPLPMIFGPHSSGEHTVCHDGDLSVRIGHDVWLARRVLIQAGVKIGHGAVIGSGAVVTRDVAPYHIVGGSPAKTIRTRFTDEQVIRLIKISWWDWSPELIRQHLDLFHKRDIDESLKALEKIISAPVEACIKNGADIDKE